MGHAFACYGSGAWEEQCHSGAPIIYDGENGIMAIAFGECHNQIHSHHLEGECFSFTKSLDRLKVQKFAKMLGLGTIQDSGALH